MHYTIHFTLYCKLYIHCFTLHYAFLTKVYIIYFPMHNTLHNNSIHKVTHSDTHWIWDLEKSIDGFIILLLILAKLKSSSWRRDVVELRIFLFVAGFFLLLRKYVWFSIFLNVFCHTILHPHFI